MLGVIRYGRESCYGIAPPCDFLFCLEQAEHMVHVWSLF